MLIFKDFKFQTAELRLARSNLWSSMCASCHNGNTAISKDAIREKYQTVSTLDYFYSSVL